MSGLVVLGTRLPHRRIGGFIFSLLGDEESSLVVFSGRAVGDDGCAVSCSSVHRIED